MSKYDKMIEENQRKSKEKIELALQAIQDMLANKERISVPKLMKKTGLSRGFFYKNPTVRDTLNQAVEQQYWNDRSKKRNSEHGDGKTD
ncbi:MAG: DUF6262 family protein [Roseburia hominis]